MDKRRMQRFYWSMVNTVSLVVGGDPDQINNELKRGYNIVSTTRLSPEQYYEYVDYVHAMFAEAFDIYFDVDYFKNEGISFTFLFENNYAKFPKDPR